MAIPTVELHRHFEAGLRPETIARLAAPSSPGRLEGGPLQLRAQRAQARSRRSVHQPVTDADDEAAEDARVDLRLHGDLLAGLLRQAARQLMCGQVGASPS